MTRAARFTEKAKRQTATLPAEIAKAFFKQLDFLKENTRHPSLMAKPMRARGEEYWQARINRRWRFYFRIVENVVWILRVTDHPKKGG